jgi:hypothetical protein
MSSRTRLSDAVLYSSAVKTWFLSDVEYLSNESDNRSLKIVVYIIPEPNTHGAGLRRTKPGAGCGQIGELHALHLAMMYNNPSSIHPARCWLANEHAQETGFFPGSGAHNDSDPLVGIYDPGAYSPRLAHFSFGQFACGHGWTNDSSPSGRSRKLNAVSPR